MIESFNQSAESKDSDESSEKKDRKPGVNKKKLGTFTAKNVVEAPNIHRPKAEKSSWWEELVGEASKKRPDLPPEASEKKAKTADTGNELTKGAKTEERVEDRLESLEAAEKQEVIRRIAVARAKEIREQTPENEQSETTAAEDAASIALLESVRQKLDENPEAPVEEVLQEAEAETVERIEAEGTTPDEEAETAGAEELRTPEAATEGEIPLHAETADDEDGPILIPLGQPSGGNGSNSGGGTTPSSPPGGTGGTGGAGGGGGGVPPRTPGGAGMPPLPGGPIGPRGPVGPLSPAAAGGNIYPAAAAAPGVSIDDLNRIVHRQERAAIAQGLLVGGIVGYLIGRRRGRIKTERRLLPIQKKLEEQVAELQSTVVEREQKVRALAAEKARDIANQEARDRFARRLAHYEAIGAKAAERRKEASTEAPRPLRLGRMVVEAPAAAGRENEAGIETPKRADLPKKQVEKYTTPELKQAAEKIRIDGTSLKGMWNRGELDQRSVERIVTQYIEGRSVRAALNKELFAEEARFEIDPKLRDDKKGGGSGGGGDKSAVAQAGAAMLLNTLNSGSKSDTDKQSNNQDKKSAGKNKQPSILAQARQEPVMQLAAAGVAAAILFVAAVLIFG